MHASDSNLMYRQLNLQEDLTALVRLLHDIEQTDQTGEQITEETLRERLTWSGQDPALNNWVAISPESGTLVGYSTIQKANIDPNADIFISVHPAWRRQGIGHHLLTYLLGRASELNTHALRTYVPIQREGFDRFIRMQGFDPISTFTHMQLTKITSFPTPTLPHDFSIRSYDQIEQVATYTEALNRGYEGYWGHSQITQGEVARFLNHLNHAGIFLLFAPDGTIAGTCRATMSESPSQENKTALIDAPGIAAKYREAKLALPLFLTAVHWLLPQHPGVLELDAWGETPEMLALYRQLGFVATVEEISYRRNVG